jgi:HEAT repeat protein
VEVSFIRDCAEMAARSSLTRTESRWGLYHDRADLPDRDDDQWRYHLNLRKGADGSMEFLKRPVAPYFVPVADLEHLPSDHPVELVDQPRLTDGRAPATAQSRLRPSSRAQPPSPRIAQVLALESPTVAVLAKFLTDPDAVVRRTAVSTLVEQLPDGYSTALLGALRDDDGEVRRVAADGVRELVEVLPEPKEIAGQVSSPDPVVRAVAVYLLSARRAGGSGQYRLALTDIDHRVRVEAVRALVSLDDAEGVAMAANDDNREVRIVAAHGLATLRAGVDAVRRLVGDGDPLVRAAALAALGAVGCGDDDVADVQRALNEPAWQVREGAARALAGAAPTVAVPTLSRALADQHLDVRKAAVLSLTRWASSDPAAREALGVASEDGDADVRAYARRALATAS